MDAVKDEVREEEEEDRSRFMEEDESPWRPLKGKVGEEENKVMPHTTLLNKCSIIWSLTD